MSPIPNLDDHLVVSWIPGDEPTLRAGVDVLLACESCFAVLDNLTEIRTTERGLSFLRREGVVE